MISYICRLYIHAHAFGVYVCAMMHMIQKMCRICIYIYRIHIYIYMREAPLGYI